jgi:phospholipase/carboxylesterase
LRISSQTLFTSSDNIKTTMTTESNYEAVILEPTETHLASVIWLHGLGADGHDFESIVPELGLSDSLGIRFIFPHAPKRPVTINGGMVMRSWYDIKDPDLSKQRDKKDFDGSADILKHWVDAEVDLGIATERIVIAGFSQGGAITLHCGLTFAQQLAGLLVLSSYLPFTEVMDEDSASANNQTPIMMMHGEFDPVIPIDFARQSCAALKANDYPVEWHDYPMQHGLCLEQIKHVSSWLESKLQS